MLLCRDHTAKALHSRVEITVLDWYLQKGGGGRVKSLERHLSFSLEWTSRHFLSRRSDDLSLCVVGVEKSLCLDGDWGVCEGGRGCCRGAGGPSGRETSVGRTGRARKALLHRCIGWLSALLGKEKLYWGFFLLMNVTNKRAVTWSCRE